ncbi:hypothetical protein KEM54_000667 [Ascosphaera aggregata]|nr:hypothetical protein KEM54_000667 [Ascosphaera aggregata]
MPRNPPHLPRGGATSAAVTATMTKMASSNPFQHSRRLDSTSWRSQRNIDQAVPPERNSRGVQVQTFERPSSQARISSQPRQHTPTSKSDIYQSSSCQRTNEFGCHRYRDHRRDNLRRLPPSAPKNQWRPQYQLEPSHHHSSQSLNYRGYQQSSPYSNSFHDEANSHLSRKMALDMHINSPIGRTPTPSLAWPTARPGIENLLQRPSNISSPRLFATYHRPTASSDYLVQCFSEPIILTSPRPLLVILDLNGTLVHRKKKSNRATCRPQLHPFLDSLLTSHRAMIWTSTMPGNTMNLVTSVFPRSTINSLVDIWARDKLRLKEWEYNSKVQVYKNLEWVWEDVNIKGYGNWDQSNTVLVDDSRLKAASHPFNLLEIPEFDGRLPGFFDEGKAFLTVLRQLRVLSWYDNVSTKIREWDELRQEKLPLTEQEEDDEDLDDAEREAKIKALKPEEKEEYENRRIADRYDLEEFWDALLDKEEETLRLEKIVFTQEQQQQQQPGQSPLSKQKKGQTRAKKREAAKREKAQMKKAERKAEAAKAAAAN